MQLGCLVCPEAGIGEFLVADRMEGHLLVAEVDYSKCCTIIICIAYIRNNLLLPVRSMQFVHRMYEVRCRDG